MDGGQVAPAKEHRASRKKGKKKNQMKQAVAKPGALARRIRLAADRSEKRQKNPTAPIDRSGGDSAPRLVAVVGPSGVGKSTIIRNLVKHYSKRKLAEVVGPVTIVSGSKRRLTFLEVGGDLSSMIDAAKVADLVLLVVDASYGFEMETFEFLNVCAAHGMPKMIGILTHLDNLKEGKQVRKIKKRFKDRFWAELYNGAKLFYLSGITTSGDYLKREVLNLARFISVTKYANIRWRAEHPYVLADRVEDITDKSKPEARNRTIAAFGYLRGTPLRLSTAGWRVHIPGVGDLTAAQVEVLADPCPPPNAIYELENSTGEGDDGKKRRVSQRERLIYAPMAPQVDGISYDRDAVYIDLPKENIRFSKKSTLFNPGAIDGDAPDAGDGEESSDGEGEIMVKDLQGNNIPINQRMANASLQLIKGGKKIVSEKFEDGRTRRKVLFPLDDSKEQAEESEEEDDSEEEESSDEEAVDEREITAKSSIGDEEDGEEEEEESSDEESTDEKEITSKTAAEDEEEEESSDDEEGEESDAKETEIGRKVASQSESGEESESEEDKSIIGSKASSVTAPSGANDSEDESNSESDDADEDSEDEAEGSEEESDIEEIDADGDRVAGIWKKKMLDSSGSRFSTSISASKALAKHIYGDTKGEILLKENVADEKKKMDVAETEEDDNPEEDDGIDDFFRPKRPRSKGGLATKGMFQFPPNALDDMTRPHPSTALDWVSDEPLCSRLRLYRFGTGVKHLANGNDGDDEAAYGDFEDLETGEVHRGAKGSENDDDESEDSDEDMDEIRQKKILKKQRFDAKWDEGGTRGDKHEKENQGRPRPDNSSRAAARYEANKEPDFRKEEQARMDKVRDEELAGLDNHTRQALEGITPGRYVRMVLEEVPTEFMKYFNPKYPVIVGGLKAADDEGLTFIRARIRRHRFKRGVLKSNDAIVMSIGWRRFQSIPIYDTEDQGGRRRYLKYSPEFLHCNATFFAPRVAPGAGVVMCQSLGREKSSFRIAGTGVITELDSKFNVVKKLKLIGEPYKVFKNTAFVKGMFNSELEASKYIGASVRTVSGIRGSIKKAMSERSRGSSDKDDGRRYSGGFRATFEDKVLLSDIVFLRCWVPVIAQRFCSMATTLLDKDRLRDGEWRMKTTREIRQARQLAIPAKPDSFYKEIERTDPHFVKQKLPKSLESSLPYASKPKNFAPKKDYKITSERKKTTFKERAVVLEKEEKDQRKFVSNLHTIRSERDKKRKASKKRSREKREKEMKRADEKHAEASKANKKRKFALDGAREKKRMEERMGDD